MTIKTTKANQSLKIPNLITASSKLIAFISPKLVRLLTSKTFTTPIKYIIPKKELEMNNNSVQILIKIP